MCTKEELMKTGTKSLLFGVHQVVWHPITVAAAWIWLYRRLPTWKEMLCIIVHDWGYWGKANMDDDAGETHPEIGAKLMGKLLGPEYHDLVLLHSRHYAKTLGRDPSKLCWADKMSIAFEPWWLYLPRAWLSGELFEYRQVAAYSGFLPLEKSHREWHDWCRARLMKLGREKRGDVVGYQLKRSA